ncbi:MAG TPA: AI-2E family transporter [Abditibacteriaceae bacterium]|jgi:predicted PurR-regulated permease PerM
MNRTLDAVILRYLGYALFFVFSAYLLYLVRGALPVFFAAALIAYAFDPVLQLLERRGYSRAGAVGFVFLVFLLLFLLLIALLISGFQQAQQLQGNLKPYLDSLTHWQERATGLVDRTPMPETFKEGARTAINQGGGNLSKGVSGFLLASMTAIFGSLGSIMIYTIVLPIVTFWLMLETKAIRRRALMIVPEAQREDVSEISASINELLGRYVRGQMIVCGLFGLLCTIAFTVLGMLYGMQYGIVLGLVAGFIYIVPYIGMATIAASAGMTAYLTSTQPVTCAILAVACCVVFNLVIDYGISPRVLGKGVGLHPVLVIFALLSGAQVGGILGMILAVPIVASLRVVMIYLFPQLTAPLPQVSDESEAKAKENLAPTLEQSVENESIVIESPAT